MKNDENDFETKPLDGGKRYEAFADYDSFTSVTIPNEARARILVVGIGGGGGNAVNHMITEGIEGVDFLAVNTDSQALKSNLAKGRMLLYSEESLGGEKGRGAGSKPERARAAAEDSLDELREQLVGYETIFIIACMGGGTGTGATPVIAELAKEMGIETICIVTKPGATEGSERSANAEAGIKALTPHTDALLVILNDKVRECLAIPRPTLTQFFGAVDDALKNAVSMIVEIITRPGRINVDFNDVQKVLRSGEHVLMGTGTATIHSGNIIAIDGKYGSVGSAVRQAVTSPFLEGFDFSAAKAVLFNITASYDLQLDEVDKALEFIRSVTDADTTVMYGFVIDNEMEDRVRVAVMASG